MMEATSVTMASLKIAASTVAPAAKSLGTRAYNHLRVTLTNCLESSITASAERCRNIKNIIYKDEPVDLLSQYVSVSFSHVGEMVEDSALTAKLTSGARLLISGRAGFGKTMFMKWSTVTLVDSLLNHQLYPIFFELRYLEESEAESPLESVLFRRATDSRATANYDQFVLGLSHGLFIIILDAVDEINPSYREAAISRIREFMRSFPKCAVLVSTRPDEAVEALQEFSVYRTVPMNKTQVTEVISRLSYDEVVKQKLIDRLNAGLFEEQQSFLSNPLLATIMLLTYDHTADIPTKITSFYKEAFEVLFQRHDAHKGTFRRDHHAGLPMDEFDAIFSFFCYQTFAKSKLEFSHSELVSFFKEAIAFANVKADAVKVVRDAIESVSLIQRDGLKFVFVHRSFQEYFAARFLVNYRGPSVSTLIDAAALSMFSKNMLPMMLELNADLIEYEWILPKAQQWLSAVSRLQLNTKTGLKRFLDATFHTLGFRVEGRVGSYSLDDGTAARWMSPMSEMYGDRKFTSRIFTAVLPPISELLSTVEDRLGFVPPGLTRFIDRVDDLERLDRSDLRAEITPRDADWLVATDVPAVCELIRSDAQWIVAKTIERRAELGRLVTQLAGTQSI